MCIEPVNLVVGVFPKGLVGRQAKRESDVGQRSDGHVGLPGEQLADPRFALAQPLRQFRLGDATIFHGNEDVLCHPEQKSTSGEVAFPVGLLLLARLFHLLSPVISFRQFFLTRLMSACKVMNGSILH